MRAAKIKVTIPLEVGGTKNIKISAGSPEARDLALARLNRCLPQIELLEAAIQQAEAEEIAAPK